MASVIVSSDNLNVAHETAIKLDGNHEKSETLAIAEQSHPDGDELRAKPQANADNSVNSGDSGTGDVRFIYAEQSDTEYTNDKHDSEDKQAVIVIAEDGLDAGVPDAPIQQDGLASDANITASDGTDNNL